MDRGSRRTSKSGAEIRIVFGRYDLIDSNVFLGATTLLCTVIFYMAVDFPSLIPGTTSNLPASYNNNLNFACRSTVTVLNIATIFTQSNSKTLLPDVMKAARHRKDTTVLLETSQLTNNITTIHCMIQLTNTSM